MYKDSEKTKHGMYRQKQSRFYRSSSSKPDTMTNERTKQPKHVKNISRSLQAGSNKVHFSTPLSLLSFSKGFTQKYRIINVSCALVICVFCAVLCRCLCTGHFVRSPLNLTCLHCLQPSFFEHLFVLYCSCEAMLRQKMSNEKKAPWLSLLEMHSDQEGSLMGTWRL